MTSLAGVSNILLSLSWSAIPTGRFGCVSRGYSFCTVRDTQLNGYNNRRIIHTRFLMGWNFFHKKDYRQSSSASNWGDGLWFWTARL
jgi:hypothetical protein